MDPRHREWGIGRRGFLGALGSAAILPWMTRRSEPELLRPPNLVAPRVLRQVAGLRPFRKGGLRLELEKFGSRHLLHHYGHGGAGVTLSFGSAELAAELALTVQPRPTEVAVVGSGVIGLTSALTLLEAGFSVRIYAKDFPPGTTSDLAGAEWLPIGMDVGEGAAAEARFQDIMRRAYRRFERLAADPEWAVYRRPAYEPADAEVQLPKAVLDALSPATHLDRLPFPGPDRAGHVRETFLIEPPRFLPRLMREVLKRGASLQARTFTKVDDLLALPENLIVVCLGLGAREVLGDDRLEPVQGQLVHLFPEPLEYLVTHRGGYIFPRHDAIVLGGTWEPGVREARPNPLTQRQLLARHRRWFGL